MLKFMPNRQLLSETCVWRVGRHFRWWTPVPRTLQEIADHMIDVAADNLVDLLLPAHG